MCVLKCPSSLIQENDKVAPKSRGASPPKPPVFLHVCWGEVGADRKSLMHDQWRNKMPDLPDLPDLK